MVSEMTSSPSDFKHAITDYRFPKPEPIYYIDLNARAGDSSYPHEPCLFLFRPAGVQVDWHHTVESFWASSLFNFHEDCVEEQRFEELGLAGEYRSLSEDEAQRTLDELLGNAASAYIPVPVHPTSCFLVYYDPSLKALVGTDLVGFFAVIWRAWEQKRLE